MKRTVLISLLLIFVLGLAGLLFLRTALCGDEGATAMVRNTSGQTVSHLRLSVWGQYCEATELAPGGSITCQFQAGSDDSYTLKITTEDGTTHDFPSVGYVTSCMKIDQELIFTKKNEIELGAMNAT